MHARAAFASIAAAVVLGLAPRAQAPELSVRIVSPGPDTYLSGPVLLKAIVEPPPRAREATRVVFYADGRLDRTLPFPELRRIAHLSDVANGAPEAGFGDHIRRELERRRHER